MSVSVAVANTCETVGEGPFWDAATSSLLYVDIMQGDVHRWDSLSGQDKKIHLGKPQISFYNCS